MEEESLIRSTNEKRIPKLKKDREANSKPKGIKKLVDYTDQELRIAQFREVRDIRKIASWFKTLTIINIIISVVIGIGVVVSMS